MNCYAEGYNAFTVGIRDNPYYEKGIYRAAEWRKGWLSARNNVPLTVGDCV